jgi:hypothetical protein
LELWGEEFAENASGTDSDSSDRGDDSEDEEEAKPDEYRRSIYREATPWVKAVLENPDDSNSRTEIESLNKKITKRNKKEMLKDTEFHIKTGFLVAFARNAALVFQTLEDPGDEKAKGEVQKLVLQLEIWLYNNSYPAEWIDISEDELKKRREEREEKKRQEAEKKREEEKKKRREEMNKEPSTSKRKGKGKGREDDDAALGKENEKKRTSFSTGTEVRKPKP